MMRKLLLLAIFYSTLGHADLLTFPPAGPEYPYVAPMDQPAPSPAAVGWGNLFVPGLGATLRGNPTLGLLEASTTLGAYFGGTFMAKEVNFTIDGSVSIPDTQHISRQLTGQFLQEVGLKLHFYNTFYNYQQASLDPGNAKLEESYQQPLYTGDWKDILEAPFRPSLWLSPWFYIPVIGSGIYLYFDYRSNRTPYTRPGQSGIGQDSLFGFTQAVGVPLGSAFGEEALFRGFFQREFEKYTGSLYAGILMQDALFFAAHSPELRADAALGGIYWGFYCDHEKGNLEPLIASHFWIDFLNAAILWAQFRNSEGRGAPFSVNLQFPIL